MTRLTPSLVERIVEVLESLARKAEQYSGHDDDIYNFGIRLGYLRDARALLSDLKSAPPAEGEREKIVAWLQARAEISPGVEDLAVLKASPLATPPDTRHAGERRRWTGWVVLDRDEAFYRITLDDPQKSVPLQMLLQGGWFAIPVNIEQSAPTAAEKPNV